MPLVLEVRDANGEPAQGVTVYLLVVDDRTRFYEGSYSTLSLSTSGAIDSWRKQQTRITDAAGRVATYVGLDHVAGNPQVRVKVPSLELEDSVRFTIQPGPGFHFSPAFWDTTVYLGQEFDFALSRATDEFHNPVPATWTASPRLGVNGARITALEIGRNPIALRYGTGTDTVWVNVVPHGSLAAQHGGFEGDDSPTAFLRMTLVEMDGSHKATLASGVAGPPEWSPDGQVLLFWREYPHEIFAVSPGSPVVRMVPELPHAWEPAHSPDGAWVYLSGTDADNGRALQIWKVRPDGTDLQRVTPVTDLSYDRGPQPSPDGTRLLFKRVGPGGDGTFLMRDLATGVETPFPVTGTRARWSPDGQTIAFGQGEGFITLVRPDGTVLRTIGGKLSWFDWSPDGRYMVVGNGRTGDRESDLAVLMVDRDELIRLSWSKRPRQRWLGPAWRR